MVAAVRAVYPRSCAITSTLAFGGGDSESGRGILQCSSGGHVHGICRTFLRRRVPGARSPTQPITVPPPTPTNNLQGKCRRRIERPAPSGRGTVRIPNGTFFQPGHLRLATKSQPAPTMARRCCSRQQGRLPDGPIQSLPTRLSPVHRGAECTDL